MGSSSIAVPAVARPGPCTRPPHFLGDLYTFQWSAVEFRLPAVSAAAVGICLAVSIAAGHPGAGLVAGGGALTIGFGVNQRITDSRILPMVLAALATALATLAGSLIGHRSYSLLVGSAIAAAIYGILTVRNSGLAWVGQQASIALFVSSAFPSGPRPAFERAGLIAAGSLVQLLMTAAALRLIPELRKDLLAIPITVYTSLYEQREEFLRRLRNLPKALPAPQRPAAILYAARLLITVVAATEVYRRLGIQSGYWIPMTALLVQKPAFYETATRSLARVAGTIAGASLTTLLISHVPAGHWIQGNWPLAALATFFAYWAFATISVNYALYSFFLTSYLVFLLSLNVIPGPEIAHRRAFCTTAGAAIALLLHVDQLWRRMRDKTTVKAP